MCTAIRNRIQGTYSAFQEICLYAAGETKKSALKTLHTVKILFHLVFPPQERPENGTIGGTLYAKNVRFLFLNGILYDKDASTRAAKTISEIFNSSVVHYTFLPLTLLDVIQAILFGKAPAWSRDLVKTIKQHVQAIENQTQPVVLSGYRKKQTNPQQIFSKGKFLVIFAHSGSGAIIKALEKNLSEKEKQCIQVISVGSAYLFPQNSALKAINLVARGDPIPYFADVLYRWARREKEHEIPPRYFGNGGSINMGQHKFRGSTYEEAISTIKIEFFDPSLFFQQEGV